MKRIDMTGQRFHKLTVLSADPDRKAHWICLCDCGTRKSINGDPVRRGLVKTCGCGRRETDHPDLGEQFGHWTIVGTSFKRLKVWLISCQCVCGEKRDVKVTALRSGESTNCGCRRTDSYFKHGESGVNRTPEFSTWNGIKNRCADKNDPDYGGRGIKVFAPWANSYEAFLAYMGRRPSPEHSIERINNDGDYEPGNVRWATHVEQCNNKRSNRFLEFNGKRQTVAQWARETGITSGTILNRLKLDWSIERALTTPAETRNRLFEFNGVSRTLPEWGEILGIGYKVLHNRIHTCGWPVERALSEPLRRSS